MSVLWCREGGREGGKREAGRTQKKRNVVLRNCFLQGLFLEGGGGREDRKERHESEGSIGRYGGKRSEGGGG